MKNQNLSVRKLARCGMVAALYVVLCMALQPFSYGAVQVRVAEALCLLPVFGAEYIFGVVLGCFLANLLGSTIVDVIFGTLATLLACLVTYKLRNIRFKGLALAASLPPVVFNAVIIGFPTALLELAGAVAMVRMKAREWKVIPEKVAVMGFSAGGHLAASLAVFWNQEFLAALVKGQVQYPRGDGFRRRETVFSESSLEEISLLLRPDRLLLSYPVIKIGRAHV